MIQHVLIRNFKSIREVHVDLESVTVLIGRSGVGKSNFLRAIRFLRNFLLQGEAAVNQEGGWSKIWPFGASAPLFFSVRFLIPGYSKSFTYEIGWQSTSQVPPATFLNSERLSLGQEVIFDRDGKNWNRWPDQGVAQPPYQPRIYLDSFPTLSDAVLAYTACTTGIGWHDFPANIFTQAPQTGALFGPVKGKAKGLDDIASNYLDVIRDITQDLRDQRARRQILARLKQINPTVDSVELDSIIQPEHVVVAHKDGDRRIGLDLSQESDGFRRYYAHLLALYQTPPKEVLMFEEPENGIYPGALRNLAEEFNAAASAGRGQVLLTTHSPDLLDGFAPEQIRVVELDEKQFTKVGPLDPDQADAVKDQLLESGELLTVDTARAAESSS